MSQNVLHQYRTYSYHHILLICDSTQTAQALASSSEVTNFQHPRGEGLRFTPKRIKGGGQYIVLVDGTTDTSLYIEKVSWEAALAKGNVQTDGRNFSASNNLIANLTLVEMNGAIFLNVLAECCNVLNISPQQVVFVLKTIFVGHTYTDDIEPITNVDPFIGSLLESKAELSTVGAVYDLSFAGTTNGVLQAPQFNFEVGTTINIGDVGNRPTLAKAFKRVEERFNNTITLLRLDAAANYIKTYSGINDSDSPQVRLDKEQKASEQFDREHRNLVIEFILDPAYEDSSYTVEPHSEANSSGPNEFFLTMNTSVNMDKAIHSLMEHCTKVKQESCNPTEPYEFVIDSEYKTESGSNVDIASYTITRRRKTLAKNNQKTKQIELDDSNIEVLNLSYIFTGRNIDILDFNMSMQFGVSYLNSLTTQSSIPNPSLKPSDGTAINMPDNANSTTPTTQNTKVAYTLNPARKTSSPFIRNSKHPSLTAQYYSALSQHASVEALMVKIRIHGNPRFLNKSNNPGGHPFEFIKVDIKMPNPDSPSGEMIDFWFKGVYRVMTYTNTFEQGMFTQTIEMCAVPIIDESFSTQTPKTGAATVTTSTLDSPIDSNFVDRGATIPPPIPSNEQSSTTVLPPPNPSQRRSGKDTSSAEHILQEVNGF